MREDTPKRTSLIPTVIPDGIKKDASRVNIARIYENDLFNTYIKPQVPQQITPQITALPLPQPPAPRPVQQPQAKYADFLPPLDVTLKGIFYSSNDEDNRAIISNNKSKQESLYRIGDMIEDARLIRIYSNKIIVVRSNGQHETLFVTQEDARKSKPFVKNTAWSLAIQKISDREFVVDPKLFAHRVSSLAEFIEALTITTAFEKGKNLGCRIGTLQPNSVGAALGLEQGDIITAVNTIPTTSTKQRVEIYHHISTLPLGSQVTAHITRGGMPLEIVYHIDAIQQEKPDEEKPQLGSSLPKLSEKRLQERAIEKDIFAHASKQNPTLESMRENDKRAMLTNGGRQSPLERVV